MKKLYTVSKNKIGSWLWLRSWTPYCKFRPKLKKVGKTTRPFESNKIKSLMTIRWKWERDLRDKIWWTECLMNYGWRYVTLYRKQGSRPSPRKEMQKNKMAVWGGLTNSCEKKRRKSKGEKEIYTRLNAEIQRSARKDKKAFLSDQSKEIEENNRMGKTRDLFRRRQWQPTPVLLPGKSHGWGSLVGCSPWGR